MTEGGGFIQRRSINVIIMKPEIKADRLCGEFCMALNYINTGFFSSSKVLKLRYTQNSLETKQLQYWPLLLCPFPAILKADGHHVIQKVVTDWNAVDLVVDREIVFHCNIHDLDFGGNGKLDPRCEEARKAVLNA
ncbi:UPF0728 protein C10orf53 homolog [Corvus moneduloides]|uniref:UPF0728 protein C10orf53 homolog n=1 Tax=Corvus moneduloides TaxID=1196302 RepID=UPI001363605C|nr:UPF0728 protein C10orf53 homolog [Corvus moneduloides]